jgi:hypothetical protein
MFKTPLSSTITLGFGFLLVGILCFFSGYIDEYMNGERDGLISGAAIGKIIPFSTGKSISFTDMEGKNHGNN